MKKKKKIGIQVAAVFDVPGCKYHFYMSILISVIHTFGKTDEK